MKQSNLSWPTGPKTKFKLNKLWWCWGGILIVGLIVDLLRAVFFIYQDIWQKIIFIFSWLGIIGAGISLIWFGWRYIQVSKLPQEREVIIKKASQIEKNKLPEWPRSWPESEKILIDGKKVEKKYQELKLIQQLQPNNPQINYNLVILEENYI